MNIKVDFQFGRDNLVCFFAMFNLAPMKQHLALPGSAKCVLEACIIQFTLFCRKLNCAVNYVLSGKALD